MFSDAPGLPTPSSRPRDRWRRCGTVTGGRRPRWLGTSMRCWANTSSPWVCPPIRCWGRRTTPPDPDRRHRWESGPVTEPDRIARSHRGPVTVDMLVTDLVRLGVEPGSTVLLHSSLSSLGWVCGGARTVVDAMLEVLGGDGTLVVPTH